MSRFLLASICLGIAASPWIVVFLFKARGRLCSKCGESYVKGFQDGEIRTHLWWIEQDRQIAEERQRIREEEEHGWRDAS